MADADALRYLRIAKADLLEARRMLDLSGFRDSSIGSCCSRPAKNPSKVGSIPLVAWPTFDEVPLLGFSLIQSIDPKVGVNKQAHRQTTLRS